MSRHFARKPARPAQLQEPRQQAPGACTPSFRLKDKGMVRDVLTADQGGLEISEVSSNLSQSMGCALKQGSQVRFVDHHHGNGKCRPGDFPSNQQPSA